MKAHGGAIVNMVANAWGGMPLMAHSGAARAGMMNLTETLALEWAPSGVRVNAVAPGYIASSGIDNYDPALAREVIKLSKRSTPMKRLGQEAEVANAIVYLLSPGAAYITGTCIRIDGGASLNRKFYEIPDHTNSRAFRGFHRASEPTPCATAKTSRPTPTCRRPGIQRNGQW